ncbi:hydrogenase maturation nickel metallochaperone HypA [bacterium]|jgi:hydrogenase nickel insertion protein HypA|nr:hydrogenase maturation nickel metallochaperone HypA [bacterium]
MHELYVAQCILDSAEKALPDDVAGSSVREIVVLVGRLDAIVNDSLTFLFDVIKAERGFPSAALRIDVEPVSCRCLRCTEQFAVPDVDCFFCPECNSRDVKVLTGRGIRIMEMTVEDGVEV